MKCFVFSLLLITSFSFSNAQPFNGFIRFDGIDDFLSGNNVIPNNSDFTLEFWFRTCQDSVWLPQPFVGHNTYFEINFFDISSTSFTYELCGRTSTNPITWFCDQSHQYTKTKSWHHIALTYNKPFDKFDMFFDGVPLPIKQTLTPNFSPWFQTLFAKSDYQMSYKDFFVGYFDEIRISDTIRYLSAFSVPTAPFSPDNRTIGLWHFEDNNPFSSISDASSSNNPLSSYGGSIIIFNDNLLVTDSFVTATGNYIYKATPNLGVSNTWNLVGGVYISGQNTNTPEVKWNSINFIDSQYMVHVYSDSVTSCTLKVDTFYFYKATAIKQFLKQNRMVKISPNPSNESVKINLGDSEGLVKIYNGFGQLVLNKTIKKEESLSIENLPVGIYYVVFIDEFGANAPAKLIKN